MESQEQKRQRAQEHRQQIRAGMSEVLNRAVDDEGFRQQFLDNPRAVVGGPQSGSAPELPSEVRQQRRQLLEQVLNRASNDKEFRTSLTQNPRQALWQGGFGPQIEQLRAEMPQEEVRGYGWGWVGTWWGGENSIWIWTY